MKTRLSVKPVNSPAKKDEGERGGRDGDDDDEAPHADNAFSRATRKWPNPESDIIRRIGRRRRQEDEGDRVQRVPRDERAIARLRELDATEKQNKDHATNDVPC